MYKEKIKIEKQDRKYLKPKLLPLLYRAEGWSPKTAMANEIRSEIKSIKFLDNHRNKRVWTLRLTDSIGHDSNVVYAPESAADESQNIGATQNKLVIKTGYNYLNQFLNGGILIYPELSFYRKYHFDRKTENIYQYDEMTLTPKVNIKYLSKVWGKYNAMILNLDYVYRQRDYNSDTNLEFYNNTLGVELGNDISLLKTGRTKVSFKYSSISSYLNDLNYTSVRWGMTQDLKLGSYKSMMVSAFMDRASYEDSRYDYNSYLLRLDLFLPNSYYDLGFIASISSNFIDTLSQSDSRGTEKVYTPSVKVIKSYTKNIKISAEYNYIYKISDSESYNYSKHVLMANIEYFN